MATSLKEEGKFKADKIFAGYCVAIVVSEWNNAITDALCKGAEAMLIQAGVKRKNIFISHVPGSYELPLGAQYFAAMNHIDGVIALGCVIQGETRHFDFICEAVAHGIMDVSLNFDKPVAFGVLTTNTEKQAKERAGGKYGNKGTEAAETVLKMLKLKDEVRIKL
jgi:6,7-dimethyl-8-ribityllumazine synthase